MYEHCIQLSDEKTPIDQSDIFGDVFFSAVKNKLLGILITPVCDLTHDNDLNFVNFCAVLPFEQLFFELIQRNKGLNLTEEKFTAGITKGQENTIKQMLKQIVGGQYTNYQWLGKLPNKTTYWYIDFELTQCIDYKKEFEPVIKQKRLFSLKSPLKEAVFVRYSTHMGRVGLPGELKKKEQYIEDVLNNLKTS
jgi:hypothetical protein